MGEMAFTRERQVRASSSPRAGTGIRVGQGLSWGGRWAGRHVARFSALKTRCTSAPMDRALWPGKVPAHLLLGQLISNSTRSLALGMGLGGWMGRCMVIVPAQSDAGHRDQAATWGKRGGKGGADEGVLRFGEERGRREQLT